MSHTHNHTHGEVKNIRFAFVINLLFAIIEFIGGIMTNSMAILADAVHDLGDSFSLGAAWFFEKFSHKKSNERFTYGYRRFSLLGALINATILLGGTLFILFKIVDRFNQPSDVHAEGMFLLALLGIGVNGLAVIRLRKSASVNSRMVMLHLMEDVLGWVAVLIAGIVIYFTGWNAVDVWLSLAIAFWVIFNATKGFIHVMKLLLQAVPNDFDFQTVMTQLNSLPGIANVHKLHVWSLDGQHHVASVHIVTDYEHNKADVEIRQKIGSVLKANRIEEVNVQIETAEEAILCK